MVNLPIEFSDKKVTPFGGMSLMKRFVDSLNIREKLRMLRLPQGHSNRAYDPVQIIESFWLSMDWRITLYPCGLVALRHCFSCYVTNMDLPLDEIRNRYNARADCENRIKELKADFGLSNFCMQDFWATEASFRFIMVAYNLMSLFRFFALQSNNRATLGTLRSYSLH